MPLTSDMDLKIDVLRTRQILINLIQNAIKFSQNHQKVEIIVDSDTIPDSQKLMLWIKVIDYGIGICEHDRANLFKPYFKSSNAQSNQMNFQSHGLGLNICKRIAKGLGGDLNLNKRRLDCTEFVVNLPVEVVGPAKVTVPRSDVKQSKYGFDRKFGRKSKPDKIR